MSFKKGNRLGQMNKGRTCSWGGKISKTMKAQRRWAGVLNPNWNGGKFLDTNRYWQILKPQHLRAKKTGYVNQSYLIAELCLKRVLKKAEILHHINGDPSDDKASNLFLFFNKTSHFAYHLLLKFQPSLVKRIVVSNLPEPSSQAKESIGNLLSKVSDSNST